MKNLILSIFTFACLLVSSCRWSEDLKRKPTKHFATLSTDLFLSALKNRIDDIQEMKINQEKGWKERTQALQNHIEEEILTKEHLLPHRVWGCIYKARCLYLLERYDESLSELEKKQVLLYGFEEALGELGKKRSAYAEGKYWLGKIYIQKAKLEKDPEKKKLLYVDALKSLYYVVMKYNSHMYYFNSCRELITCIEALQSLGSKVDWKLEVSEIIKNPEEPKDRIPTENTE